MAAIALAVVAIALRLFVRNRVIRRRLRFTLVTLLGLIALHVAARESTVVQAVPNETAIEQLLLAFALVNVVVTLLLNPWFTDRVPDRAPAIVQDTVVIALFGAAAVFVLKNTTFLAASAIAAAAIGFALQDTLANAFAGLAIQVEKPFRVGHWVAVAGYEGIVAEVTWRATKLRTKSGTLVILPNNTIAKEAIHNYSEPAGPTRLSVDVGAAYGVPPNEVRAAITSAMKQVPRLLPTPPADVLMVEFGGSAITYRARFWTSDFEHSESALDEVRRAIYYEFRRRSIEIPWPVQVQYMREEPAVDQAARRREIEQAIARTALLVDLDAPAQQALAGAAAERMYADGEAIVRAGEPGDSMFLVERGRVAILAGSDHREVATTESGGYFGEMSLLTGEPRTATVIARGDCTVLEIRADAFRTYVTTHPAVIDQLAQAAASRRRELDAAVRAANAAPVLEPISLARKIKEFFGIR